MSSRRVDPKDQFSKKLAKWSSWFWFLYMLLALAAAVIQPLASDSSVYLAGFSSVVMILNLAAYTHNSVYDKAIAAGAKAIGRFHFSWKRGVSAGTAEEDLVEESSDGEADEVAFDPEESAEVNPENEVVFEKEKPE